MITRVPSGIVGLDALIGGGFIQHKVYLVSGETGTGKTIFGLQFLRGGIEHGENGIYISADEKPGHLMVDAAALGWDFNQYIEGNRLELLDLSSRFNHIHHGKASQVDVRSIAADLARHARRINAKRIVIDPIAPFVFGEECLDCIREYVRNLILAIEDNIGCTVVATSGIPSGSSCLSLYGVAEFMTEGVILLGVGARGEQRVRTLYIKKMRSTPTDCNDHIFQILPDAGITLKE